MIEYIFITLISIQQTSPILKVDMRKVNLDVMRPWIANKVIELVGFEDEVVVEYAMGLLEDPAQPVSNKIVTIVLNNVDV